MSRQHCVRFGRERFSRVQGLATGFALALLVSSAPSFAAAWKPNVSYGGSILMELYVPDKVDASPAAVVVMHGCGSKSGSTHAWLQSYADQYGFVLVAPTAGGNCFDAAPIRSGEREAITKMVTYVIAQNKVDAARVYAVGFSSGGCMTNALMAAYPDVFAAGSVLAGVPAGAWDGGNDESWSTPADRTAAQWGDLVRNADPGFTGKRPRLQIWHGAGDTDLTYSLNFPAEVAQWTNVLGVGEADATKSEFKTSQDTWARVTYKNASDVAVLETNVAQGAPHQLNSRGLWVDVVRFLALEIDGSGPGGGSGGASGAGSGGASGAGSGGASAGSTGAGAGGVIEAPGVGGAGPGASGSSAGTTAAAGTSTGGKSSGGAASLGGGGDHLPSSAGKPGAAGAAPLAGNPRAEAVQDGGCSFRGAPRRETFAALGALLALVAAAARRRRGSTV